MSLTLTKPSRSLASPPVHHRPLKLCLFGAPADTGNLGVSALGLSLREGMTRRDPDCHLTVFDHGKGLRPVHERVGQHEIIYDACGALPTRRLYKADSLWRIRMAGRGIGPVHLGIKAIRGANAVLDVTGGDSFTDLYGPRRFRTAVLHKLIALEQGCPLILLPQTIGPFESRSSRRMAGDILRRATMVWTRDERSYEVLAELLDDRLNPMQHRCGVDLAFGLRSYEPDRRLTDPALSLLRSDQQAPVIGFNISGLIFNNPRQASTRYGLVADYRKVVVEFLSRILRETTASVVLIPHVITHPRHAEHDPDANAEVVRTLGKVATGRVIALPPGLSPGETKWAVAQVDWFCGTRMHSTIAGLSSGVPTAAIAYSPKHAGVFATCGQRAQVIDPRQLDTLATTDQLWAAWSSRHAVRRSLARHLPDILRRVEEQIDDIMACCQNGTLSRHSRPLAQAA